MTNTAIFAFLAVIVAFLGLGIAYRQYRVRSFARALAQLGGRATRPPVLPDALDWEGTEIIAARAFDVAPGVPVVLVALMRSPMAAVASDIGATKADPFLVVRLPAAAVADADAFRATLARAVALEAIFEDDPTHLLVAVRAPHTGKSVLALADAVRAGLGLRSNT